MSTETASQPGRTIAKPYPAAWLACTIWGTGALFYLAVFFLRAAPAVMTSELMRDFHIGAASLGNLSAFYFYFYVAAQIPVGILTNSWGPRRLLVWGALLAAGGQFLFGSTDHIAVACAGRAIIGGSTAVGWLVTLRLAAHWFPNTRFGMVSGLGLLFGNLGALFAQVPLRLAVEHFGWRGTAIAPPELQTRQNVTPAGILKSLRTVFSFRNTWLILLAQGGMVGPIMTFTGLWGPSYLRARFGLEPKAAATICSVMIICWAAASPVFGGFSDRIRNRKKPYLIGSLCCALGWISMFYAGNLPLAAFTAIAASTSFATGCVIIAFAYGRESVPAEHMGTATATANIGNMLGNVFLQPGIGLLLDWHWSGAMSHGGRVYDLAAYRAGFLPVVVWAVVSSIAIALTRETHCRQSG